MFPGPGAQGGGAEEGNAKAELKPITGEFRCTHLRIDGAKEKFFWHNRLVLDDKACHEFHQIAREEKGRRLHSGNE